jgi:hypothetical protein
MGFPIKTYDPIATFRIYGSASQPWSVRVCQLHGLGTFELTNSSFLGSGSEILISSVFESAPPPVKESVTPPKASSVSINSDSDDEEVEGRYDTKGTNRTRPDSPLAKIFGFGAARSSARDRPAFQLGPGKANQVHAEVEGLKAELKDVRESQLRMEEMLSKMISGK